MSRRTYCGGQQSNRRLVRTDRRADKYPATPDLKTAVGEVA